MSVPESDSQPFLGDTVSIAQAAHEHVNVDDFSALAQATAADHNEAPDTNNASSTAAAALNMYPSLHVPQSTEEAFANQASSETHHEESSFSNHAVSQPPSDGLPLGLPPPPSTLPHPGANGAQQEQRYSAPPNAKPAVGSEEWHKMRKDNHKEVERRRRETINEGINELAKIVPGCEKNKGSILQRAVAFITQLKENETQNIEKWTLEKLLTEQAIAELSQTNDKLKQECDRLYRELEAWKQLAQDAGLQLPQPKEEPGSSG
ncbi:b6e5442b-da3f-443b-9cb8-07f9935ea2c7 [Thermothielavioides terrestris]|nr:b6e5442b-da3f-443b-9cb8-07f9935ea2c7 [Thermothielavioides terrestris]